MNKGLKDKSYFCPQCQSPLVTVSALAGGDASCGACTWKGAKEELLGYKFESGFDNPEAVLKSFANDIRNLLAKNGTAVAIGQLIIKWGFVTTMDVPTLSRYVGAIARGIASAVLEERKAIEQEKKNVS